MPEAKKTRDKKRPKPRHDEKELSGSALESVSGGTTEPGSTGFMGDGCIPMPIPLGGDRIPF